MHKHHLVFDLLNQYSSSFKRKCGSRVSSSVPTLLLMLSSYSRLCIRTKSLFAEETVHNISYIFFISTLNKYKFHKVFKTDIESKKNKYKIRVKY